MTIAASAWGVYKVPSETVRGRFYYVLVGPSGAVCPCADATFGNRYCKHVKALEGALKMTTQALIKIEPRHELLPTEQELESMNLVAANLIEAGQVALPESLKSKEAVRAVIMAGWELGVKPMTALRHMTLINGKPEPDGQLMASIAKAQDPSIQFLIVEDTAEKTTVRLTRAGEPGIRGPLDVLYTYSQHDAEVAGLSKKAGPWQQHPRTMRRWACFKNLCRAYLGELINGVEVTGRFIPSPDGGRPEPDDREYVQVEGRTLEEKMQDAMSAEWAEASEAEAKSQPGPVETAVRESMQADDLYNEGDEPEEEDDDEGVEDVAMVTPHQLSVIQDWIVTLTGERGEEGMNRLAAITRRMKEEASYAVEENRLRPSLLTAQDAQFYLERLAEAGR